MLLNAISNFNPVRFRGNFKLHSNPVQNINFTSNDTFKSNKARIKSANFSSNLDDEQIAQITKAVKQVVSPEYCLEPIGTGANGNVYLIDDVDGFWEGLTAKVSHTQARNPVTGEMQRVNESYDDEIEIIKTAQTTNPKNQTYVADFKLQDGRNIFVSSYVTGTHPDINKRPFSTQSLSELLETFEELDEKGILHRDLKKENILIDIEDHAGLIDYGQAIYFDTVDYLKNSEDNHFPTFVPPTNLRNFEDTCLFPYINELRKEEDGETKATEFFKTYLTLKAPILEKRADAIERRISQGDLDENQIEQLNIMRDYLLTMAEAYKEPDDDIVKAELLSGEITYNSELAYKNEILLLNPLANSTLKMNSLVAAKRLEAFSLNKLQKPNTVEKRDYFKYQNDYAKYRLQKVSGWLQGLTGWLNTCFTTDVDKAQGDCKEIIHQLTTNENIGNFEIPKVETI